MSFWWFWSTPPVVVEAEAGDFDHLAEIYARSFNQTWDAEELAALAAQPGVFVLLSRRASAYGTRRPLGFVVARKAGDEAEILTIAVDPRFRGRGIGRQLMQAVIARLYAERASCLFLEVDAKNKSALMLYRGLGMRQVGVRRGYYSSSKNAGNALVMRVDLN